VEQRVRRFGALMAALEDELQWELLGRTYCDGDGTDFFDAGRRERVLDVGLRFADDLGGRLAPGLEHQSLYLGAAVAELAPILFEHVVLGRRVHWLNTENPECRELTRALGAVCEREGVAPIAPSSRASDSLEAGCCDHLWLVSVLTDPEAFPALHDELYQRAGGLLATGRGDLHEERGVARRLARNVLERADRRALLCTTDEELEIVLPVARELGRTLEPLPGGRISALVGDRVRLWELRAP